MEEEESPPSPGRIRSCDASGAAANVLSGDAIALAVNGVAAGQTAFHSLASHLNPDGVQHVLSGVAAGGDALRLGFEDLTGGGDRDYEDVVFQVERFETAELF